MKKQLLALGITVTLAALATSAPKPQPVGDFILIASTTAAGPTTVKALTASYTHPKRAPEGATASLDVPAGLGVGPNVPVTIQNVQGTDVSGGSEVIRYWGCGTAVPKGQPEHIKSSHTGTGKTIQGGSSGTADYARLGSITGKDPGAYLLKTSYAGNTPLTLTEAQEFLDPVAFTEPSAGPMVKADLSQPIKLSWTKVPRAVGYSLMASGTDKATGKPCMWESIRDGQSTWYTMGTTAGAKAGKLLPADHVSCTIPAGIFEGSQMVSVMLIAYSADVRGAGSMTAVGWAQSTATLLIQP